MTSQQPDFAKAIKELEEINKWFQSEDIDLDQGLEKLKRGKELINKLRGRLKDVENEFTKIRDDFSTEEATPTPPPVKTQPEPHKDHIKPTMPNLDDDIPF